MAGKGNSELIALIKRLAALLHQNIDLLLKPYDLARTQYVILRHLQAQAELPTAELRQKLQVEAGTLSGLLDTLEVKGLVKRTEQVADKRRKNVKLTAAGSKLLREIPPPGPMIERVMLRGMTPHEARELKRIGWRLIGNLETELYDHEREED